MLHPKTVLQARSAQLAVLRPSSARVRKRGLLRAGRRRSSAEEGQIGSGLKARRGKVSSGDFSVFMFALCFSFEETQTPALFYWEGNSLTWEKHGLWSQEDLSGELCFVTLDKLLSLSKV